MITAEFPINLYCSDFQSVEILDRCHGDADFRKVYIVDNGKGKIVIKHCSNSFTDRHKIEGYFRLAAAYNSHGIYCPSCVQTLMGESVYFYREKERDYYIYAEEYALYNTAEYIGRDKLCDVNGQPIFLGGLMRSIGVAAKAHLDTVDWPSQFVLFEHYSPQYDHTDETTQAAVRFAGHINKHFPEFRERSNKIMSIFYENQKALQEVYHSLPSSCFQGDLNDTNILVDENGQFAGLIDFNCCGREPVLNYAVREALMHIEDRILFDESGNEMYFYNDDLETVRIQSFLRNMSFISEQYPFSDTEKAVFPLLFRYVNSFWWEQVHAIRHINGDPGKVEKLLNWIEFQLNRDDIRLP